MACPQVRPALRLDGSRLVFKDTNRPAAMHGFNSYGWNNNYFNAFDGMWAYVSARKPCLGGDAGEGGGGQASPGVHGAHKLLAAARTLWSRMRTERGRGRFVCVCVCVSRAVSPLPNPVTHPHPPVAAARAVRRQQLGLRQPGWPGAQLGVPQPCSGQ